MFEEKPNPQIYGEENKEKEYNKEYLLERMEKKVEIYKKGGENEIIEISEELRDAVVDYVYDKFYLCNKIKIEGMKEKEKLLLYFYKEDLYLTALEGEGKYPHALFLKDEGIINKVKELILAEKEKASE